MAHPKPAHCGGLYEISVELLKSSIVMFRKVIPLVPAATPVVGEKGHDLNDGALGYPSSAHGIMIKDHNQNLRLHSVSSAHIGVTINVTLSLRACDMPKKFKPSFHTSEFIGISSNGYKECTYQVSKNFIQREEQDTRRIDVWPHSLLSMDDPVIIRNCT